MPIFNDVCSWMCLTKVDSKDTSIEGLDIESEVREKV